MICLIFSAYIRYIVEYDVAVVGAGPSGSTAARYCAKAGLRTLLIEKDALPRPKVCGGGLTEKTLSFLDFDAGGVIEGECWSIVFCYGDTRLEVEAPFRIMSYTTRSRFDALLAEKAASAGAELAEGEVVESVSVGPSSAHLRTSEGTYEARIVVGADGVGSVVAPLVRERLRAHEVFLALEADVPDETVDTVRTYFDRVPYGYGWVFPKRDSLSAGVCCRLSDFKNPERVFRGLMAAVGLPENTPYGAHLIPFGGFRRPTSAERILLVGDAAGFADPLTGEGIRYAIQSGKIAAETIVGACSAGDFSNAYLRAYEQACFRSFGGDLSLALRLSRRIYGMREAIGRNLSKGGPLLQKALGVYANRVTYREFMQYLLPKMPQYSLFWDT